MTDNALQYSEELNAEQTYAATYQGRHLLVLAGAGSGKTRTIIARAKYLITHGIKEDRIRIVSFTNKSAEEIVSRILSGLGEFSEGALKGQTFHSWCYQIIKSHPELFAQSDWSLLIPSEILHCIGFVRGRAIPETEQCPTNEQLAAIYSRAMNTRVCLTQAMRFVLFERDDLGSDDDNNDPIFVEKKKNTQTVIREYIAYKEEHHLIDYDDMLDIVAQTMQQDAEAREIIASEIDHILVDEMQDTNKLQYEVLLNFTQHAHLFCVGDDAQSIYAFRGADFESIHSFTELVPDAQICRLETNYRSTQPILDISNWLLKQSPLNYNKNLHATRDGGEKPEIINWTNSQLQASDIVTKIIKSINNGDHFADHLVLARKNYELNEIKQQCVAKKIPYQIFGGIELMESAHVLDLLSTFRIVANPLDELAWIRFLKCFRNIGDATAARVVLAIRSATDLADALHIIDSLQLTPGVTTTLNAVHAFQDAPSKAVDAALRGMELSLQAKYGNSWVHRKKDFPALRELALSSANVALFVEEFLMNDKLLTVDITPEDGPRDLVTLSTIHSAKGLEAKNVYILNVTNGYWPDPRSLALNSAVEEERRCLYVALTRAKDHLCIYRKLNARNPAPHDLLALSKPLYFLDDLPADLVSESVLHPNGLVGTASPKRPTTSRAPISSRFNFD